MLIIYINNIIIFHRQYNLSHSMPMCCITIGNVIIPYPKREIFLEFNNFLKPVQILKIILFIETGNDFLKCCLSQSNILPFCIMLT